MHSQLGYTKLGIFILIFHLQFVDQGKHFHKDSIKFFIKLEN